MFGHLPPAMETSFASGRCLPILLFRVDLPAIAPLCLIYGSGELPFDGQTFSGSDDRFGSLTALDMPEDGVGDSAPMMSFSIATPDDSAAAVLASPTYQGSRSRLWIAALDPESGAFIGSYLIFDGEIDRPMLELEKGRRSLDFDCVSGFERFFSDSEGQRLAAASHQAVWPNEDGFQWVTGVQRAIIWGPGERPGNEPYSMTTRGFSGSGGGGGGFFGGRANVNSL